MAEATDLYVLPGQLPPRELAQVANEIMAEIQTDTGELADEAREVGWEPAGPITIAVTETRQGFLPLAALALAFASGAGGGIGKGLAGKLWNDVIFPEIRRRRGADAVGPEVVPSADAADDPKEEPSSGES